MLYGKLVTPPSGLRGEFELGLILKAVFTGYRKSELIEIEASLIGIIVLFPILKG
jgi:hypothetical protein